MNHFYLCQRFDNILETSHFLRILVGHVSSLSGVLGQVEEEQLVPFSLVGLELLVCQFKE